MKGTGGRLGSCRGDAHNVVQCKARHTKPAYSPLLLHFSAFVAHPRCIAGSRELFRHCSLHRQPLHQVVMLWARRTASGDTSFGVRPAMRSAHAIRKQVIKRNCGNVPAYKRFCGNQNSVVTGGSCDRRIDEPISDSISSFFI